MAKLSQRQRAGLLKLGSVVALLEDIRRYRYNVPNYVLRALEIIENVYDEIILELPKEVLKELYIQSIKMEKDGRIVKVPEDFEHQFITAMFNLADVENVFKKKKRPIHYVFLVLFKFLKKKIKAQSDNKSKWVEAIVDYCVANGYSFDYIEQKAKAYAEKLNQEKN